MTDHTFNERMLDASISHQIGLMRFREGLADRTVAQIIRVEADLRKQLRERLSKIEERGFDLGPRTTLRLQTLTAAVREILARGYHDAGLTLKAELRDLAKYEVDFQTRMIQANTPFVELAFNIPPAAALTSIVANTPIRGTVMQTLLRQAETRAIARANEAIRIGMIEGETTRDIVRRVMADSGSLGLSKRGIMSLVRTAVTHVAAQAREDLFAANPDIVAGVMWVSTLDSRTSDICIIRDGQVYPPKKGPRPPAHINCRSGTLGILNGQSEIWGDRASSVGPVPAKTTYPQYLRRQPAAFQDEILGKTRGRLFRQGGVTINRFIDRNGRRYTLDELRLREAAAFDSIGL